MNGKRKRRKALLRLGTSLLLAFALWTQAFGAENLPSEVAADTATDTAALTLPRYDRSDDALFELVSLGILRGDENGDLHLEDTISRAEFAMIAARLIRADAMRGGANVFSDVLPDAYYADAVNVLAGYGFLRGDGDGRFRPQDTVTKTEVYKALVSLLGYDIAALEYGAYPSGYLTMAARLGLSGAGEDGDATRDFVVHRIYEAMDVSLLEPQFYTEGKSFQVSEDKTLRGIFYQQGEKRIIHQTGLLSSTRGAFLAEAVGNMTEHQVELEGVVYDCAATDAETLWGRQVEYIAVLDANGRNGVLLGIRRARDTHELSLRWEDISRINEEGVVYDDGMRNRTARLSDAAMLVRNGRRVRSWTHSEITGKNGTLTLIDNDGDRRYDVMMQEEYIGAVVSRIGEDVIYFKAGYGYGGALSLNTETTAARYVELRNAEGERISVSALKPDDVLSIAESEDGEYIQIRLSRETLEGVIDKVSQVSVQGELRTEYQIGDREFYAEAGRSFAYGAGDSVLVRLNALGTAVLIENLETINAYGWIYDIAQYGFSNYQVRMLLPGKLSERTRVDDTDPDNVVTTPYLRAANADIAEYRLASRIQVDGSAMQADSFAAYMQGREEKLIQFTCDATGAIRSVKLPIRSGTGEERYYNSYEKTFGKLGDTAFGTTEQTDVIIVPTNAVSDKRDFCAGIELDINDQKYTIAGYDVDDDTHVAEIVVLRAALDADASANIEEDAESALAESVETWVQEDGSTALMVTLWSNGSKTTYRVAESAEREPEFGRLRAGSVFRYALSTSEELSRISYEETLTNTLGYYRDGSADRSMQLYGMVEEVVYNDISFSKNRYVHRLTVRVNPMTGATETIDINVRNTPSMYLYDPDNRSVKKITPEEIVPGRMCVYARVLNREVKALVFTE